MKKPKKNGNAKRENIHCAMHSLHSVCDLSFLDRSVMYVQHKVDPCIADHGMEQCVNGSLFGQRLQRKTPRGSIMICTFVL